MNILQWHRMQKEISGKIFQLSAEERKQSLPLDCCIPVYGFIARGGGLKLYLTLCRFFFLANFASRNFVPGVRLRYCTAHIL